MYAVIPTLYSRLLLHLQRPLALVHLVDQQNLRLVVPLHHQASAVLSTFSADPYLDRFDPQALMLAIRPVPQHLRSSCSVPPILTADCLRATV